MCIRDSKMKAPVYYDHTTDCHPFWHIRRSNCVGEFNSAVVQIVFNVITSTHMKVLTLNAGSYHPPSEFSEFEVTVPCIVNTAKIAGGAEIVVKCYEDENMYRDKRKRVCYTPNAEAPKQQKQ